MMINYPEFEAMLLEQEAGATTVLFKCINILYRYFNEHPDLTREEQRESLEYIYTAVRKAHPLMAIFPNLHAFILDEMEKSKKSVPQILTVFAEKIKTNIDKTIETCVVKLIKDGSHIFTFSHSSVVRKAIMKAAEQGKRFEVVLTEARPVAEGLGLAKYLGRAGIPVSLYTDAAMELAVSRSDMVLVGTDWYWHRGFINKIGTHSALRIAEEREKLFYILTDSSKYMPTPPADWSRDKHPESQILMESIENVTVFNPYFESIWYRGVEGIVIDGDIKKLDEKSFEIKM